MAVHQVDVVIDGKKYQIITFGTSYQNALWAELIATFGAPMVETLASLFTEMKLGKVIGSFMPSQTMGDKPDMEDEEKAKKRQELLDTMDTLGKSGAQAAKYGFLSLFEKVEAHDLNSLFLRILQGTAYIPENVVKVNGEDVATLSFKNVSHYDAHFSGEQPHLIKVVLAVLGANFEFFSGALDFILTSFAAKREDALRSL